MRRATDTQRPSLRPKGPLLALLAGLAVMVPALAAGAERATRPALAYAGPATVRAGTVLTARTPADRNIVAVTFRVDGKPFASDTVAPYTARVLPGELAPGRHQVAIEVVYRSGDRRRSARSPIEVPRRGGLQALTVSPARFGLAARRMAAGNVTVRLLPGRYAVRDLPLGSNVTLVGSGPATVLETAADDHWAGLVLKGSDITVANLAIRPSSGGKGRGIAVQPGSQRIMLRRLDIVRTRDAGVYVWGAASEVTVQDSRIDGGTTALSGVIVRTGEGNDASVIRTRITRFAGFGILFSQLRHDNRSAGLRNVALDNDIADIDEAEYTDGRSKGGIWSGGALASIIGNRVTRTGWDGIQTVGSSYQVAIARNTVSRTRVGIYLEHATHSSLISRNVITDVRTGVNVEWFYDGVGSADNQFVGNAIHHALIGIFVDYGSDRNLLSANRFHFGGRPSIILQGASQNRVVENVACGAEGAIVREQSADPGTGVPVRGTANVIEANTSLPTCS
jgi:nitrous oxidase accessory protein NosD